ncbi:hypothetical protein F4Z98_06160 [Candidatus Poribacteria bacterium]|nr:hypothetical protein [Candidatus Poribacteria bacterium]MYB01737.1 hypothetical protein [Candidatus Poribacteria bacterium]
MTNTTDLATALNQTAKEIPPERAKKNSDHTPARAGKKMIGGHFSWAVHKQLKQLALDRDCSIQTLLEEALDQLMINSGLPGLKEVDE